MTDSTPERDTTADGPQSPDEIRAEIERTQQALGDTVEALAAKTDVKAQAAERVQTARETVSEAVDGARQSAQDAVASARENVRSASEEVRHAAQQATPESAAAGAQQVTETVRSQPLPFATVGAFAAGVLLGWLFGRR